MARFFDTGDGKSSVTNRRQEARISAGRRKLVLLDRESETPRLTQVRVVFDVTPRSKSSGNARGWPACLLVASGSATCREISNGGK